MRRLDRDLLDLLVEIDARELENRRQHQRLRRSRRHDQRLARQVLDRIDGALLRHEESERRLAEEHADRDDVAALSDRQRRDPAVRLADVDVSARQGLDGQRGAPAVDHFELQLLRRVIALGHGVEESGIESLRQEIDLEAHLGLRGRAGRSKHEDERCQKRLVQSHESLLTKGSGIPARRD